MHPTQSKYPEVIDGEMDIWEDNMAIHEQQYLDTVNRLTEKAKQFIEDPTEQAEFIKQIPQLGRGNLTIRYPCRKSVLERTFGNGVT